MHCALNWNFFGFIQIKIPAFSHLKFYDATKPAITNFFVKDTIKIFDFI